MFTVFTTACDRPEELKRLYRSLLRQTYKDFRWLIVDDSTDDCVCEVIGKIKKQGLVQIDYHRQKHKGRYWAQRTGFALVNTPYMIDIDDDDELTDDCLETLAREWEKLEDEKKNEIGVICGMCIDKDGKELSYHDERPYIDTDYIEMEWTQKHPSENLISRKKEVVENVAVFCDEGKWLSDKISFVRESVLWNRIAKKYKSRYINHPMRIYHTESDDRLSIPRFGEQRCIDYTYSNYVILNELKDRVWENPKDAVKYMAEYMACGSALKYGIKTLMLHLDLFSLKVIAVLLYPFALQLGKYFRKKYFVSEEVF